MQIGAKFSLFLYRIYVSICIHTYVSRASALATVDLACRSARLNLTPATWHRRMSVRFNINRPNDASKGRKSRHRR